MTLCVTDGIAAYQRASVQLSIAARCRVAAVSEAMARRRNVTGGCVAFVLTTTDVPVAIGMLMSRMRYRLYYNCDIWFVVDYWNAI